MFAVIKLCYAEVDVMQTPLRWWMLKILRWLIRPMSLYMRNLKKPRKMFVLQRTWWSSLPLFWHPCCSNVAQGSLENNFPSYIGHDIPEIRLPSNGGPTNQCWFPMVDQRCLQKENLIKREKCENNINGSTSEWSHRCHPRETALNTLFSNLWTV